MDTDNMGLSDREKNLLKEFRFNLKDLITTDHTNEELLKWLKAKNFNLRKAEQNFREVDSCRKMFHVSTIIDTYIKPKVFQNYDRQVCLGIAKDGSAIQYYGLHLDYNGFAHSISAVDMCLFFWNIHESIIKLLKEQTEKTGKVHSGITFICDLEGFSLTEVYYKSVIEIGLDMFKLLQVHYPEIWRQYLVVNAPYIVDKVLTLFKPVFNSSLMNAIQIAPKSSTKQLLRKYIDDDVLPAFLGGTRVDSKGDPYCQELYNGYSKIPEEYYLKNIMHLICETDSDVMTEIIRPRSVFNVTKIVKTIGAKIRLEMRTENGSICFSTMLRDFEPDSENAELPKCDEYLDPDNETSKVRLVTSTLRIQSHLTPIDITYTACWPGVYIFHFNNTSSWLGSRKLYYRITISPPDL